ncbi:MAG: alpha-amylase [Candidatus Omnitrophica bacterium]|nr:alpha-amylase [Candidatus Omnitrophota bacterium]MBU1048029.1 alpha-amylase [Candidatus Omnitrophota bacterium]MBU1631260.1 alpha-amylase [Candidatus Omnitrophota bacterium]MBU1767069.1 alpha-amylase [Candidatus Omnitrophota bacterium]MBU1889399.1 alpha-amylase [Candidatus Omnitrophota bacterium]
MLKRRNRFRIISCALAIFFLVAASIIAEAANQGVFYEIFVRSFYDSDSDGIGDFNGLIEKLDYLNDGNPQTLTDLEIKGIWLMPTLESPSYHGYDVVDYYKIESDYGTEEDFNKFVAEAHKRGISVIIDLVLNHTSSRHRWFADSCRARKSKKKTKGLPSDVLAKADWYVWKDTMPQGWWKPWGGGESKDVWHYKKGSYYYSAFSVDMPDLNYKNREVIEEMKRIIRYWLNKGIDGFRLDAVRYLIEESGGVSGQADLKQTHKVLTELASYAKSINKDCILIGEVWADNKIVSEYYGEGNELNHAFNFDLAAAIINSIKSNDYREIENVLNKMNCYNAPINFYSPFLTNHDQNRIASELNGDEQKLKLAASLLLSVKGTPPFIYYGEEIGMTGRGQHRRIRIPMQWDDTENGGFTKGKPWEKLQDNFISINVSSQELKEDSLLNHYKKFIRIRNKYGELIDNGEIRSVGANNDKIYAYIYTNDDRGLLFIHNFDDKEAKDIKLNLYDAGIKSGKYEAVNLLSANKKMEDVTEENMHEYEIISLGRYESLVLDVIKK